MVRAKKGWWLTTKVAPFLPLLSASVFLAAGCSSLARVKTDPFYESFYQKTQLIMLDAEKEVYRLLEDRAAKEDFIEEFWKLRDPEPGTEENEAKTAFEERVRYACRWFSDSLTPKWKENYEPKAQDRGWETDMGRVYIILGPPDLVDIEGGAVAAGDIDRRQVSSRLGREIWFYKNLKIRLEFVSRYLVGGMALNTVLLQAMEDAVLDMLSPGYEPDLTKRLKFRAEYRKGALALRIPTTRVIYKEEGGKLWANFKVKMNVYLNGRAVDAVETEKGLETTEDALAEQESFELTIPYPLRGRGQFLLDILLEDLNSLVHSRARAAARAKG